MIYQTGKIISDGRGRRQETTPRSRRRRRRRRREEEKERRRRRKRMLRGASYPIPACPHHVSVSAYVILCISLYIRVHVCRVCIWYVYVCIWIRVLRRYSNTRPIRPAWRYQVSNGPNVRKSPEGAYRGRRGLLFLTKSSRTRAAGNFIRCPCNNTGISRRSSRRAGLDGYTIGHFGNPCLASGEWQLEGTTEYPRDWRTRPSLSLGSSFTR